MQQSPTILRSDPKGPTAPPAATAVSKDAVVTLQGDSSRGGGGSPVAEAFRRLCYRQFAPPPLDRCRIFLVGPSKSGKSTFAAGNPHALFIDLEGGAHSIPRKQAWVVYCPALKEQELTPEQVSELVRVPLSSLRKLVAAGRFPAPLRIGRHNRWHRPSLERWLEHQYRRRNRS